MGGTVMCGGGGASPMNTGSAGGGQSHSHNLTANYVGDSQTNLPPYLVLVYIIKS